MQASLCKLILATLLLGVASPIFALDFYPSSDFLGTNFLRQTNAANALAAIGGSSGGGSISSNRFDFLVSATNLQPWLEGRVYYDQPSHTLAYFNDRSNVTVNVGQEMLLRGKNLTGSVISNGAAVTLVSGSGSIPHIGLAQATTNYNASGYDCIGVATEDIAQGDEGMVTLLGIVHGVNTDSWTVGTTLWLSTNAGALTTNPPPANYAHVIVGAVARGNGNNGDFFIQPQQATHVGDINNFTNSVIAIAGSSIPIVATNKFATTNALNVNLTGIFNFDALYPAGNPSISLPFIDYSGNGNDGFIALDLNAGQISRTWNGSGLTNIQGSGIAGLPATNLILTSIPIGATNQFTATNDTTWFVSRSATNGLVAQNGIATNISIYGNGNTLLVSNNTRTIVSFESNTNSWSELRVKNRNAGMAAQSTLTVEADNGTTNSFYSSLNMNSSTYTNGLSVWPYGTNWASWTTFGNPTNYANAAITASAAIGVAQTNASLIISVGNGLTRTNVLINDAGITLNNGSYFGNGSGLTNLPVFLDYIARLPTNILSTNNFTQTWGVTITNNGIYDCRLKAVIIGYTSTDRPNLFVGATNTDVRGYMEYSFVNAGSSVGGYGSSEINNLGSYSNSIVLSKTASGGGDFIDGTRSILIARSVAGGSQYLIADANAIFNVTNAPVTLWTIGRTGTTGTNVLQAGSYWRITKIQ